MRNSIARHYFNHSCLHPPEDFIVRPSYHNAGIENNQVQGILEFGEISLFA